MPRKFKKQAIKMIAAIEPGPAIRFEDFDDIILEWRKCASSHVATAGRVRMCSRACAHTSHAQWHSRRNMATPARNRYDAAAARVLPSECGGTWLSTCAPT